MKRQLRRPQKKLDELPWYEELVDAVLLAAFFIYLKWAEELEKALSLTR